MRRRGIIRLKREESRNGNVKNLQEWTGLGGAQHSGQHRERQEVNIQRPDSNRRGHALKRSGGIKSWRAESESLNEIQERQDIIEVQRDIRPVIKGVCLKCGRKIGKGIAMHMKHCKGDDHASQERA